MTLPLHRGALLSFLLAAFGLAPPAVRAEGESDVLPLDADARRGSAPDRGATAELDASTEEVGPYRVGAELGAGGMGVVHAAESQGPVRRRVALKRIQGELVSDAARAQFAVEVEALARLEHEHIVRLYEAGPADDGAPWFAMELVDGEPLSRYCERRALGLDARLALIADVARAVAHMHTRGVVHGDLKPKNILVQERDGRPIVKVIDLGSARLAGRRAAAPRALMGTLAYMAPELLGSDVVGSDSADNASAWQASDEGQQRAGELCDIYALGMVLRELVLGDERAGTNAAGWLAQALARATTPLVPPSTVLAGRARGSAWTSAVARGLERSVVQRRFAQGLEEVLERATAFDARRRTTSAARLADALERDIERSQQRAARWSRVREWCAAAAAGAWLTWLVA